MRVLMITDHVPFPPVRGTEIRNYNLLKRVADEHEVWIATFAKIFEDQSGIDHLLKFCRGVETADVLNIGGLDNPVQVAQYFLRQRPIELRYYESPELVSKIKHLVSIINFDVIDIVDSYMGLYLEALPLSMRKKTILTFIDVVFSKYDRIFRMEPRFSRKFRMWLYSRMMRHWEPFYAERFARGVTVSEADRQLLLSSNPRLRLDVIPNGIDASQYQILPYTNKPSLIFVGNMGYRPNIDAMLFFGREVYPQLEAIIPHLELWIVGLHPPQEIQELGSESIHVTGTVDDVRPFYERCSVCIVPLRAGGGTRLKILEAMALGRPVISTSIGCEGLEVVDGEHLIIADTKEQIIEKTLLLLRDEDLRKRIIERARDLVVRRYDWGVIAKQLIQTYSEVAK